MIERTFEADNLWQAYFDARKNTSRKECVQKFGIHLCLEIQKIREEFESGKYFVKAAREFILRERGHIRHVTAFSVKDRVVIHSYVDNTVQPKLAPKLIYDNYASQKGKGQSLALKRVGMMARKAYALYGENAYVLQIDGRKFFDNVNHDVILEYFATILEDDELDFLRQQLKTFEVDVSYMSEEEYREALEGVFISLDHYIVEKSKLTGEKYLQKSAPIGNQISQDIGVFYLFRVDNYCKIVLGLKFYARYMDDTTIILNGKDEAERILALLHVQYEAIGLKINAKKIKITKLTLGFTFLKIRHVITATGKIRRFAVSETFRRERRKLRKYKGLVVKGKMTYKKAYHCYKGWRGMYSCYDNKQKIYEIDNYFKKLFSEVKPR